MVLEWIEGPTLLDILRGPSPPNPKVKLPPHVNPSKKRRITWYNQLVEALCHLHSFGLNHGDLSLLNIHIETRSDSIKLIDFGRSVSVEGYPCASLYLHEPERPTPTMKGDKKLPKVKEPAMFKFGGAWVEPETRPGREGGTSRGRESRPKLFDRSTNSSTKSSVPLGTLDVSIPDGNPAGGGGEYPSRPLNHASRLLQQQQQLHAALGTHMPVTLSRGRGAGRDGSGPSMSRPSSTGPIQTRYHLSTSPMSPRAPQDSDTNTYGGESEPDDWMTVDNNYGAPTLQPHSSGSSLRDYGFDGFPSRRDSDMYTPPPSATSAYGHHWGHDRYHPPYNYYHPHYRTRSPPSSHPTSRRTSRSPARYGTPAEYANSPRGFYPHGHAYAHGSSHLHPHRSSSRSRHSRSPPPSRRGGYGPDYPPPPPEHYGYPPPDHYGYPPVDPYGYPLPPPDHYGATHGPPRPPPVPKKPPVKAEQIHPGSRPFCAPEILRASSGTCIDSRTKQWIDPILADAYSLGIVLVCMDLCKLVDIGNERQKREDGKFPDLSETTIFTELIRGYTRPAAERQRISLDLKMDVPEADD